MKKTYKINEIFYSLQGEGKRTGCASIFIRFSGCNLKCPFCDTKHEEGEFMTMAEIAERIKRYPCKWIVLTGGEPTLFIDESFIRFFHEEGYKVAIETNGTKKLDFDADFITLSPKCDFVKDAELHIQTFDELKVVYDGTNDLKKYDILGAKNKYVQPCDTGDPEKNKQIIDECVSFILYNPSWRMSLQTQKILNVR